MSTKVADLMKKKVFTAGVAELAEEAWNRMQVRGVRHLVVLDEGRVAGVLSDRDLAGNRGQELREGRTVARMMTPGAVTVEPSATLREAAGLMRSSNVDCLPVLTDGKLRGIVTTSDILDYVLHHPESCCTEPGTAKPERAKRD
jgi:predicted transcriptional regulator